MEGVHYRKNFYKKDGIFHCEQLSLLKLHQSLSREITMPSPVYVYSEEQIRENIKAYKDALEREGIDYILGYSIKANFNPSLTKIFFEEGCAAVTVSGNEVQLALGQGVQPQRIILNGNGKQKWEIELALKNNCLITVDSLSDLEHIVTIAETMGQHCDVLFRVNPNIDAEVHPYLATGISGSKFGLNEVLLPAAMDMIKQNTLIKLLGIHCHLGSTIRNPKVYEELVDAMQRITETLRNGGFHDLKYINIGGGLGIDYLHHKHETSGDCESILKYLDQVYCHNQTKEYLSAKESLQKYKSIGEFPQNAKEIIEKIFPDDKLLLEKITSLQHPLVGKPNNVIEAIASKIKNSQLILILEPGRSLIGNAGIIMTKVIGCKQSNKTNYITVDASMNEVIRPSLYGAYHHIELAEPSQKIKCQEKIFDIVGPVCECGDFLGKDRFLREPHEGCLVVVHDVGAYCSSMSSNYNMRPRPAEVLVSGQAWKVIRKPDNFSSIMQSYCTD